MVTSLQRPDAQTLFNDMRALFETTVLGGGQVIPESNEWYAVTLQYAMAESFYAISDQAWRERDPRQACEDNLVAAAAKDGVFPLPAQSAQGFIKITGTVGEALPSPIEFEIDGQQFTTANQENQPLFIETDGEAVVRVAAVTPGAAGNLTAPQTVTATTALTNVTDLEMCGNFCSGADAENVETFRSRYVSRLQFQPRATATWVRERLADWPCVTRVIDRVGSCCTSDSSASDCGGVMGGAVVSGCGDCGCGACSGQIQYYVMFDNTFPNGIPPRSVLDEIQTWMFGNPQGYGFGQVEIGVCGKLFDVNPVAVDVNIELTDCPNATELDTVRTAVTEFFATLEPSQKLEVGDIRDTITRLVTTLTDYEVTVTPVNNAQFYGSPYGENTDLATVYATPCALEPDCDTMLTLNSVSITVGSETF